MNRYRVSADIGGTFTDVVAIDKETGRVTVGKASTTPRDLTEGIFAGLSRVVQDSETIDFLVHGTTQGLNAFLERRGETVLLLASQGVGDVYYIARGDRRDLYELHYRKPEPLVRRRNIVEIAERLNSEGGVRTPLDEEAVRRAAQRVRDDGFGAVAVAFLFSYVNPAHELRAAELLRDELGEDFPITLSHQVANEWREYERTSSAVIDAYIAPTVRRYLNRLKSELNRQKVSALLHIMQSNGGIITADVAENSSLQTLLSGPVGGTMGGVSLAKEMGVRNLICIDMGGTSFDVSLVMDQKPDIETETYLEGFPILLPVVKIHTVGAGGGSVAYEEAGGLRVGPRSAGAEPGPACYARGGIEPTVTDANLLLGRIDPDWFAGGTLSLDQDLAAQAMEGLGQKLGLDVMQLAEGIGRIVNTKMAQAIRAITVEKGIEPRDYSLLTYGGAGPMHACFLAEELGISQVIVPQNPGAFSAWGMLQADMRQDFAKAYYAPLDRANPSELANELRSMASEGGAAVANQGVAPEKIAHLYGTDMRYRGQEYTLTIAISSLDELTRVDFKEILANRFHQAHLARFGHNNPGAPTELVALRVAAIGEVERAPKPPEPESSGKAEAEYRNMTFDGKTMQGRVIRRSYLRSNMRLQGPALVLEDTATTVVPPGWELRLDRLGSMDITRI